MNCPLFETEISVQGSQIDPPGLYHYYPKGKETEGHSATVAPISVIENR